MVKVEEPDAGVDKALTVAVFVEVGTVMVPVPLLGTVVGAESSTAEVDAAPAESEESAATWAVYKDQSPLPPHVSVSSPGQGVLHWASWLDGAIEPVLNVVPHMH